MIQLIAHGQIKERSLQGFGQRLKRIRQGRALTQQELGDRVGVSQRVVAYYESDDSQPLGALLVELARALEITADELLGIEQLREKVPVKKASIRRRLQQVEELPTADQKAALKFVDALVESRGIQSRS